MAKSDWAENQTLTTLLAGTRYIALCSAAPTDSQTGSNIPELSGNGYARQAATFTTTGSTSTNAAAVNFTASGGNWVQAAHVVVLTAATGGNVVYYGALTNPITLNNGETGTIPIGSISISEN